MSENDPIIITVTAESACAEPNSYTVTVTGPSQVHFELADESEDCSITFDNDTFGSQVHPEVINLTSHQRCRHVTVTNAAATVEGNYQIAVGDDARTCTNLGPIGTPTMIIEGTDEPPLEPPKS